VWQTGVVLRCSQLVLDGGLTLVLVVSAAGVRQIEFPPARPIEAEPVEGDPLLDELAQQLRAYFAGARRRFDLPLDPQGTPFQKRVWQHLETIPFGVTQSYRQVADAIGTPQAVRAVGAANGANPIPIVIPCHRVIGSGGRLTGYGGGLPLKKRLLELEGAWTADLRFG
jgi:methylated-DNA-[protein]-cysteine S-methyltransferase